MFTSEIAHPITGGVTAASNRTDVDRHAGIAPAARSVSCTLAGAVSAAGSHADTEEPHPNVRSSTAE